jgi:MFS family permease
MLCAAAVLLAAFLLVERAAEEPLIPLELFRDRNVTLTSIASMAIGAGMFAAVFFVPLFMQSVAGLSAGDSGLALAPLMLGLILASTASGIAISRTGRYKAFIVLGPIIGALGLWLMSGLGPDATILGTAWRVALVGAGIGMVMQNIMLVAQNSVDLRFTGVITSLLTLTRSVGGTVGIAVLGTVFASSLRDNLRSQLGKLDPADAAAASTLDSSSILRSAGGDLPPAIQHAIRVAADDTLTHLFALGIPFMLVALLAVVFLRRDQLSDRSSVAVVEELELELADLVPTDADHAPRQAR